MLRRSLSMLVVVLLLLLLALSCVNVFAHNPASDAPNSDRAATPKPFPFEPDEQLTYEGEFSKLLLRGINIVEFKFTVERVKTTATATPAGEQPVALPHLVFKADAVAKGWFRKLFGIDFRYTAEAIVEPASFQNLRTTTRDEQGKRLRTSETVYDRARNQLTWTQRNPNDPQSQPRVVTAPLGDATHDLITAIYYLRTQPLEPGRNFELMVSDAGAVYHIPVKVGSRKRMKSVVGRVQAVRVDLEIFGSGRLVDRKGELSLWFTDDARRLPIRARVSTDLGTIDITLKKVSGGSPVTRR
ncbi:MAG: DUF3108 domain-containing protein [Pyrinomonadaceae bacterium]